MIFPRKRANRLHRLPERQGGKLHLVLEVPTQPLCSLVPAHAVDSRKNLRPKQLLVGRCLSKRRPTPREPTDHRLLRSTGRLRMPPGRNDLSAPCRSWAQVSPTPVQDSHAKRTEASLAHSPSLPERPDTAELAVAEAMKDANHERIARPPEQHGEEQAYRENAGEHGESPRRREFGEVIEM